MESASSTAPENISGQMNSEVNTMCKKTVLIADDDRDLLTALEFRCKHLGLEVVTAEDALTALSCVDFAVPDLVCLDVDMPGGNGLATCEMMASDERLSSIPVIIITGSTDDQTVRRCQKMRAHYVLKGSDTWSKVEPLIRELLDIRKPSDKCPA
jgi:CheY-like chemotaxis protein